MEPTQMTEPLQNRRYSDEHGERIVKLETQVQNVHGSLDNISDKLNQHVTDNARGFAELRDSMTRLAVSSEVQANTARQQADSMNKLATTVSDIAKNDFKISTLEDFRVNTMAHLRSCDAKHEATRERLAKTEEKTNRLYWLAPLALLAIQGIWQVYTFFAK